MFYQDREIYNMNGYWLTRSEAIYAMGITPSKWNTIESSLERKMNDKGTKKYFWITEDKVTQQYKEENIPQQKDVDQILQQLNDNVDLDADDLQLQSINVELKKARKDQILTKTKLLVERLQQRKKALFNEWSEKFFQCFSDHFGKLKNTIVELHLNEQQVKLFNQGLDKCLENLQINLDDIWNDFINEQKQENQK